MVVIGGGAASYEQGTPVQAGARNLPPRLAERRREVVVLLLLLYYCQA